MILDEDSGACPRDFFVDPEGLRDRLAGRHGVHPYRDASRLIEDRLKEGTPREDS